LGKGIFDSLLLEYSRRRTKRFKSQQDHLLKMEITYDKQANAIYIEFRKGSFAKNKKIDDFTIIDFDNEGNILGIELLDFRKKVV